MKVNTSPIRFVLVVLLFCTLTLNGFTNMVFSARAVDVMGIYDMTQAQLTSISGVSNLGGFFFSILFGFLADKFGVRKFPSVVFAGSAAVAIVRCFVSSYWPLWICTFVASSLYLPGTMLAPKILAPYFEPRKMASVMGIVGAGAGMGTTIAFGLANLFPTTRAALWFIAIGTIAVLVVWLITVKDHPEAAEGGQQQEATGRGLVNVLKSPTMIKVMICGGLAVGCAILINSYAVTCMIGKGMSEGMASATATVMNICLLFGGIVAGFIVDRVGKYNIVYLLICAIGGVGYWIVYRFVPAGMPTLVGMGICAFIVAGSIGVNMGRINLIPMTKEFGPEMVGAAGGMNNTMVGLFGWLFPVIIASIFGTNYVGMFTCGAVCFIILGCFGLLVPELGSKGKIAKAALEGEATGKEAE